MPLMNPETLDKKLTDAIEQINRILAHYDKRLTELEEKAVAKPTTRKAS